MKKITANIALLVLLLVATGCKHDTPEYIDFSSYQNLGRTFVPMSETTSDIMDEAPWDNIEEQVEFDENGDIVAPQHAPMTRATSITQTDLFRELISAFNARKVHQVAGVYESTDLHGNPIRVSGKFFYPKNEPMKNLIVVSHYTIGANREAPSETFSFEGMFAALGYGVIMADYIGFGVTADSIHPYLQAETTARNVIDMALAVRPFIAARGLKVESDEIILLGYSQGGATTLHVQRLLETLPEYKGLFKIKKNYAGAGPYDIARTYDYCVKQDKTGIPCAIPMIIQGMSAGMDKPLDMEFFFKDPLLSHYNEWLNSKQYTVNQMSTLIGVNRLSKILTENGIDRTKNETARFYRELIQNSIPRTYFPQAPLYMFHSEDDQTVPFVNSQVMQRQFREKSPQVEYDFGHYGNHMKGAIKFLQKVGKELKK